MKKTFLTVIVALMTAVLPHIASAQSASADAKAEIVAGLQIANDQALDFGRIKASTTADGTCTIATDGERTSTEVLALTSSTGAAAAFTVSGAKDATYAITIPTADITLTNSADPSKTMTVSTFTAKATSTGIAADGKLDATTGEDVIKVGATLNIKTAQETGSYTGTFEVSVAYN